MFLISGLMTCDHDNYDSLFEIGKLLCNAKADMVIVKKSHVFNVNQICLSTYLTNFDAKLRKNHAKLPISLPVFNKLNFLSYFLVNSSKKMLFLPKFSFDEESI